MQFTSNCSETVLQVYYEIWQKNSLCCAPALADQPWRLCLLDSLIISKDDCCLWVPQVSSVAQSLSACRSHEKSSKPTCWQWDLEQHGGSYFRCDTAYSSCCCLSCEEEYTYTQKRTHMLKKNKVKHQRGEKRTISPSLILSDKAELY